MSGDGITKWESVKLYAGTSMWELYGILGRSSSKASGDFPTGGGKKADCLHPICVSFFVFWNLGFRRRCALTGSSKPKSLNSPWLYSSFPEDPRSQPPPLGGSMEDLPSVLRHGDFCFWRHWSGKKGTVAWAWVLPATTTLTCYPHWLFFSAQETPSKIISWAGCGGHSTQEVGGGCQVFRLSLATASLRKVYLEVWQ